MKTQRLFLPALALTLPLAGASAVTITTNTALSPGDTNYEGAALIVSTCTLAVNGAHSFASLLLIDSAVLTHSPALGGHGGPGGNGYGQAGRASYDALLAPTTRGSGGGSKPSCGGGCPGSAGGGRIRLSVGGVLTVDGLLTADGESAWASGGAGAAFRSSPERSPATAASRRMAAVPDMFLAVEAEAPAQRFFRLHQP
ncbi:MAG: hypothetical protein HZA90_20305 [Verrucomicrobia bacterium]|nr:hypothetical protein [Verrucomicrobiota bacterium]